MAETKELKTMIVNRETWNRGGDGTLYKDGSHCILGKYLHQELKISNTLLEDQGSPDQIYYDLKEKKKEIPAGFCPLIKKNEDGEVVDRAFVTNAIIVNDDETISDVRREGKLKTLFKNNLGILLKFVGGEQRPKKEDVW